MSTPHCPPLTIDRELAAAIEEYRVAKAGAAAAVREASSVEKLGHYDKDTPLAPRTAREIEATTLERASAIKLADALLGWVDRHH